MGSPFMDRKHALLKSPSNNQLLSLLAALLIDNLQLSIFHFEAWNKKRFLAIFSRTAEWGVH